MQFETFKVVSHIAKDIYIKKLLAVSFSFLVFVIRNNSETLLCTIQIEYILVQQTVPAKSKTLLLFNLTTRITELYRLK